MLKLLKKLKKKDFILIFISLFIITLSVYLELELPTYTKELTRLIQLADSQIEDILLTGGKMLLFAFLLKHILLLNCQILFSNHLVFL